MDAPQKPPEGAKDQRMKIVYRCDLSKPYRRAIAFDVLRIVAESAGYVVDKATLNGAEVRLERVTQEREYKDEKLIRQIDEAENNIDDFWERYDLDGSQTIDEVELEELLRDLKMPASVGSVSRNCKVYVVDNSGLLEKVEILEFLEQAKKDVRERTKPRTVMAEAGRTLPYELPLGMNDDGSPNVFEIQLSISPERDEVVRTTSSVEMAKIMTVARKADNRLLALQLSLGNLRLQVEEARELIKELRLEVVNPIEVLSSVIRYMSNAQHSQLLVTLELKDNAMRDLNIKDQLQHAVETMSEEEFEKFQAEKMQQVDKMMAERRRELEGLAGFQAAHGYVHGPLPAGPGQGHRPAVHDQAGRAEQPREQDEPLPAAQHGHVPGRQLVLLPQREAQREALPDQVGLLRPAAGERHRGVRLRVHGAAQQADQQDPPGEVHTLFRKPSGSRTTLKRISRRSRSRSPTGPSSAWSR